MSVAVQAFFQCLRPIRCIRFESLNVFDAPDFLQKFASGYIVDR